MKTRSYCLRNSNTFLDTLGVKDKSKIVLTEDPISQEKRYLEMRKTAKLEKAAKSISNISFEVDSLGGQDSVVDEQVSAYDSVISRGGRVAEKDLLNLIEMLMNQLLKLDSIVADGDVKLQRTIQVTRVQKYVETLDVLKIKNATAVSNENATSKANQAPVEQRHRFPTYDHLSSLVEQQHSQQQLSRCSASQPVLITTQWESFDAMPGPQPHSASTSNSGMAQPRFSWDLLQDADFRFEGHERIRYTTELLLV